MRTVARACFLLAAVALAVAIGCEDTIRRGTTKGVERAVEDAAAPGGRRDPEALAEAMAYAEGLEFAFTTAEPEGTPGDVTITGTVRNPGPQTVAVLRVHVSLRDAAGVECGGATDLLAHSLPLGENNTPLRAHDAKHVVLHASGVRPGWRHDRTTYVIEEAVLAK